MSPTSRPVYARFRPLCPLIPALTGRMFSVCPGTSEFLVPVVKTLTFYSFPWRIPSSRNPPWRFSSSRFPGSEFMAEARPRSKRVPCGPAGGARPPRRLPSRAQVRGARGSLGAGAGGQSGAAAGGHRRSPGALPSTLRPLSPGGSGTELSPVRSPTARWNCSLISCSLPLS